MNTTGNSDWQRERLLEALDAYNRGLVDAPLLRKRTESQAPGAGLAQASNPAVGPTPDTVGRGTFAMGRKEKAGDTWYGEEGEERGGQQAWAGNGGSGPRPLDRETPVHGLGAAIVDREPIMTFAISTEDVDRHGDVLAVDGWRLESYLQNPVFLWAHDYARPVIGRAARVWKGARELLAEMDWAPTEFAQEVAALYRSGYQRGVSVGFRPIRYEERRDARTGAFLGIRFLEQELLEVSAVPVPANASALRRRIRGLEQGFDQMDDEDSPVQLDELLAVIRQARPGS